MDDQDITLISLWVHVPLVITWIGLVMLDVVAAFAPGLDVGQRSRMIMWSRWFVIVAIPVIMITGIWQTIDNPFLRVESYSGLSALRERTLYGDLLFWKHAAVIATFGLTILVRFFLAPRMGSRGASGAPPPVAAGASGSSMALADNRALQLVRTASVANLVACLFAILLATRMVLELH